MKKKPGNIITYRGWGRRAITRSQVILKHAEVEVIEKDQEAR